METQSNQTSGGIGFLGVLGIVFITLKLLGVINWSWWLVTAPLWGGFALMLVIILPMVLLSGVFALIRGVFRNTGK